MKHQTIPLARWFTLIVLVVTFVPVQLTIARPIHQQAPKAPVSPTVLQQLASAGQASYWVILNEQADLSGASQIADWDARGEYVYDRLTSTAAASQQGLVALLDKYGVPYTSYWIVNAIYLTSGQAVLDELSLKPEVKEIAAPFTYVINENEQADAQESINTIEWNIANIKAPQVWSTYGATGAGIVVASMGTGVQYNHPALVNQYRGNIGGGSFDHNYNWYDPTNTCSPVNVPCDNVGNGTHTVGIMVGSDGGSNQIGVAPGARFIAAKGCATSACSSTDLTAAAQWMLAPTDLNGQNPDPAQRPHVVHNPWGGPGNNTWFQSMVQSWVASGIFPVFKAGDSGPACSTINSPGDYPESYAVGYYDSQNNIAASSSRGPSAIGGIIKPNIAAPGVSVRSSVPNNSYASYTGSSIAAAHVAGTVALMWSFPFLNRDIVHTRIVLDQSAIDMPDLSCGGAEGDNAVWGEGRLDAFAAVTRTLIGGADAVYMWGSLPLFTPVVAYNSNHDEYLVVWVTSQDAYTHDVWARRLDDNGNLLGPDFCVATAPGEIREMPAVAFNPTRDEYLVAYTNFFDNTGLANIMAKRVAWDGGYISAEIAVTQFTQDTHVYPDVAYNSRDDEYLVVFQNQWGDGNEDIYAQRIRGIDGVLLSWSDVVHDTSAYRSWANVAYNRQAYSGNGGYLITYHYLTPGPTNYELRGKVSQNNLGDLYTNPEIVLASNTYAPTYPALAAGRQEYLLTWRAAVPGGTQVRGRHVALNGVPQGNANGFEISPPANWSVDRPPAVAHGTFYGFLVTWLLDTAGPTSTDLYASYVLDGRDSAVGNPFVVDESGPAQDFPDVACAPDGDCLVVYSFSNGNTYFIGGRFLNLPRVFLPFVRR